jgi:hypothetical protein
MKQHSITIFQFILLLSLVIGILPIDARPSGPPEDFSPLFDGKTFKG